MAFTVKTYGRMDVLVNGAAGNFLANAHELKLKVGLSAYVEWCTVGIWFDQTAQEVCCFSSVAWLAFVWCASDALCLLPLRPLLLLSQR